MTAADRIARLGLGTVQFGLPYGVSNARGQVPPAEARAILRRAQSAGIRVLDTAAAYGNAEEVLADILDHDRPFRIVTKTIPAKGDRTAVETRARRSAERLGAPVDTLLVHSAGDLAGADGADLWRTLEGLRDAGLFRRIGISAYVADDPVALARRYRPAVMQVAVSLIDQRLIADGTLGELKALDVEVHVRSVFLQGLLLMAPDALPKKLAHAAPALAAIRARIAAAGVSPVAAALAFVLDRPEIDVALVGVTCLPELDDILIAAATPVPALDWAACRIEDAVVLTPSLW